MIVPADEKVITVAVTLFTLHIPLLPETLAPVTFIFLPATHPSVINVPDGDVT